MIGKINKLEKGKCCLLAIHKNKLHFGVKAFFRCKSTEPKYFEVGEDDNFP